VTAYSKHAADRLVQINLEHRSLVRKLGGNLRMFREVTSTLERMRQLLDEQETILQQFEEGELLIHETNNQLV
jgi:hypothetical protein